MAGTRIAVDDSIADIWSNPAKGVFIAEPVILGAPTFYGVSNEGGAGKTFPFTGLLRDGDWFGGASVALQQVSGGLQGRFWGGPFNRLSEQSARNLYGRTAIGRELGDAWSVGVAVSHASLNAMTGVDQLYAGADRIDQQGGVTDLRAGVFRDGERDRLGLTLIHNRVSMEHDVHYTDVIARDSITFEPEFEFRQELNQDKTRTLGAHFEWDREVGADGWRIGATLTANHKSHPKIPNYDIQRIPRDPGTTWAYEMGFGIGRTRKSTTFGIDLAYQPIWSHTWQEADERLETPARRSGGRRHDDREPVRLLERRAALRHRSPVQEVRPSTRAGGSLVRVPARAGRSCGGDIAPTGRSVDGVDAHLRDQLPL